MWTSAITKLNVYCVPQDTGLVKRGSPLSWSEGEAEDETNGEIKIVCDSRERSDYRDVLECMKC